MSRFEGVGEIVDAVLRPEDAGLPRTTDLAVLQGGDAGENARTLVGILSGDITDARRDLVLLNAAAGFVVTGLEESLSAGVERAQKAISGGDALRILQKLQTEFS